MLNKLNEIIKLPEGYYFGVNVENSNIVTLYNENRMELAEYTLSSNDEATISKLGLMLEDVFSKINER